MTLDKKQVGFRFRQLRRAKIWQLVVLFILSCLVSATLLRLNNIGMVQRRSAVLAADEVGDASIIKTRLLELQRYVTSHMNADMGKGVYLEASYKRDVQKAYESASVDSNPNGNIYKKAQEVCEPQFDYWTPAYIQCTISELEKYPASSQLVSSVNLPQSNSYRHVFLSPLWSADFAGFSVLVSVVILIMIIFRIIGVVILRAILHYRYSGI